MKLYLTSYRLGNEPEKLVSLVGSNKHVAVICNATDFLTVDKRNERVERETKAMSELGFVPEELDLREYFYKPTELEKKLSEFGLLWVRGGNVFILRKAMALSGFDKIIRKLLDKNIVYAGFSAASCVAGPTLHGIELCDDINLVPDGYPTETIWDGLNLIDYAIAPHYHSDHPESEMINYVVAYFEQNDIPFKTLRDGETIIVND
jgi:dipeptidase E